MPLFQEARTGEGVWRDPLPRRSVRTKSRELKRLTKWCQWYHWKETRGFTDRELAEVIDKPLATVNHGLKQARTYLIAQGLIDTASYVAPLVPVWGPRPLDVSLEILDRGGECPEWCPACLAPPVPGYWICERGHTLYGHCPTCRDDVRDDATICGVCLNVSPANALKLQRQRQDTENARDRQDANWQAAYDRDIQVWRATGDCPACRGHLSRAPCVICSRQLPAEAPPVKLALGRAG